MNDTTMWVVVIGLIVGAYVAIIAKYGYDFTVYRALSNHLNSAILNLTEMVGDVKEDIAHIKGHLGIADNPGSDSAEE